MASNSKKTAFRRSLRADKMGAKRKARARNHGTTPPFPVHTPDAIANAPQEQLRPEDREQ